VKISEGNKKFSEILRDAGIQTKLRTYIKSTVPKKETRRVAMHCFVNQNTFGFFELENPF